MSPSNLGAYDPTLLRNADARAWARAFSEKFPAGGPCPDEGTMLGWFANAMMAMYDHLADRGKKYGVP